MSARLLTPRAVLVWALVALALNGVDAEDPADKDGIYPMHPTTSKYVKLPGVMQFGDVVNLKGENGKWLSGQTGTCVAVAVGDGDGEDFGLVHPKSEDKHDAVQSGDLVAIRATGTGKFLTLSKSDDNVAFGWSDKATGGALFRIVAAEDVAKIKEESTSEGKLEPSGAKIPYKEKQRVMLFPQLTSSKSSKKSSNTDKYSVYAQENGNMYFTDSIFMGWTATLAQHNECYKKGDVAEGITCCNWKKIGRSNQGVASSEQRLCCRRTGHHLCHATEKRIRTCADGFVADEVMDDVQTAMKAADESQAKAKQAQEEAAAAQVGADNAKSKLSEAEAYAASQEKSGASDAALESAKTGAVKAKKVAEQADGLALEAEKKATKLAAKAKQKRRAYEVKSLGGMCCGWTPAKAGKTTNPRVFDETCCSGDGCKSMSQRIAHKECSWNGELTSQGCKCDKNHGGSDCAVEASTSGCFAGIRKNGQRVPGVGACKTCYKCKSGLPKRVEGRVVVAGDDRCSTEAGPETLCLSCDSNTAGLIRFGDSHRDAWRVGYHDTGSCKIFPSLAIAAVGSKCYSNCYPRGVMALNKGSTQVCTKACTIWNQVKVQLESRLVEAVGLCHAEKETHCVAEEGKSLSDFSKPRKCFSNKNLSVAAVCYVMQVQGNARHPGGFGTGCSNGAKPAKDLGISDSTGKWCCYEARGGKVSLPSWMKQTEESQWCAGPALDI